jgi:hypothetical protein
VRTVGDREENYVQKLRWITGRNLPIFIQNLLPPDLAPKNTACKHYGEYLTLLIACLPGLLFYPADGDNICLLKIGKRLSNFTTKVSRS